MVWTIRVEHVLTPPPACAGCESLAQLSADIAQLKELITMNHAELTAALQGVASNVEKIGGETRALIAKIADLHAAVENAANVPQEVIDALAAVQAQVAVVDELVPDA